MAPLLSGMQWYCGTSPRGMFLYSSSSTHTQTQSRQILCSAGKTVNRSPSVLAPAPYSKSSSASDYWIGPWQFLSDIKNNNTTSSGIRAPRVQSQAYFTNPTTNSILLSKK